MAHSADIKVEFRVTMLGLASQKTTVGGLDHGSQGSGDQGLERMLAQWASSMALRRRLSSASLTASNRVLASGRSLRLADMWL